MMKDKENWSGWYRLEKDFEKEIEELRKDILWLIKDLGGKWWREIGPFDKSLEELKRIFKVRTAPCGDDPEASHGHSQ